MQSLCNQANILHASETQAGMKLILTPQLKPFVNKEGQAVNGYQ